MREAKSLSLLSYVPTPCVVLGYLCHLEKLPSRAQHPLVLLKGHLEWSGWDPEPGQLSWDLGPFLGLQDLVGEKKGSFSVLSGEPTSPIVEMWVSCHTITCGGKEQAHCSTCRASERENKLQFFIQKSKSLKSVCVCVAIPWVSKGNIYPLDIAEERRKSQTLMQPWQVGICYLLCYHWVLSVLAAPANTMAVPLLPQQIEQEIDF